jgi:hypothetical protein
VSEIAGFAAKFIVPFLLFCLVCSAIREAIEAMMNDRAKYLHRALRHLTNDYQGNRFLAKLYEHALIDGLYSGAYDPRKLSNLPAYIPSKTLALALMDLIPRSQEGAKEPALSGAAYSTTPGSSQTVSELRRAVMQLPDDQKLLRAALITLIDAAGEDPIGTRQNIEDWFNAAMNRASAWYKQRTQMILAMIGFTVALALNLDGIALGQYLVTHDAVMSALTEEIKAQTPQAKSGDILKLVQEQGRVPIGWSAATLPHTPADWLLKLCGIYAIGFLMSIGSPFCFDVLNKFMVFRTTTKPPEPVAAEATASG